MSDYIPDHLVVEILKRLPVKSLLRFRSVCKSWYSLISNPTFISTHLNHNTTTTHNTHAILSVRHPNNVFRRSLHYDNDAFDKQSELEPPFEGFNSSFTIVGCCNGLICATNNPGYGDNWAIVLWNPSIKKFVNLPMPNIRSTSSSCVVRSVLGFGFDPMKDEYKVVRIVYLERDDGFGLFPMVELYELSMGSWRGIDAVAPPFYNCMGQPSKNVNGAIHWVAYNDYFLADHPRRWLVAFDIATEVFREIRLPDDVSNNEAKLYLSRRGKLLSLFHNEKINSRNTRFSMWEMKEYGVVESWCREWTISLPLGIRICLGLRSNGEVLLVSRNSKLVSYNRQNGQAKNLDIPTVCAEHTDLIACQTLYVDTWMESLLFLERPNGLLEI